VDSALNRLPVLTFDNGFEKGAWQNEISNRDSVIKSEGNYSLRITPGQEFSPGPDLEIKELGITPGDVIEISASFYCDTIPEGASLVMSLEKDNTKYFYNSASIGEYAPEPGTWNRVFAREIMPEHVPADARLKIYCWNAKKILFFMDDFRMSVYSGRR
jgi:hypothetical protein